MNGPRPSILSAFDPLHSSFDQENSADISSFLPQPSYPNPVRLTRRLIDVGDVTVQEVDEEIEDDGEEEDDTIAQRLFALPLAPPAPLVDDGDRTPIRPKVFSRPVYKPTTPKGPANMANDDPHILPSLVVCAPEDEHSPPAGNEDATLSNSLATLPMSTPSGSLIADATMAFPTPSEASASFLPPPAAAPPSFLSTSFNPDRSSADLHTSFALHVDMNSGETSFDLLNDKISFLGYEGDEESFEMMGSGISVEDVKSFNSSATPLIEIDTKQEQELNDDDATPELSTKCGSPPPEENPVAQLVDISFEIAAHPSASSAIPLEPAVVPSAPPALATPPARQFSPIPVLSTSFPAPPAIVPSLKIVKRKRPDAPSASTTAKIPVEVPPAARAPSPAVPPPVLPARVAPSTAPSVGQFVMEGPGPRRVPNPNGDKPKAGASKALPGATVSGPRRVPLPSQAPAPAPPPPAPPKAVPKTAQATAGVGKRPLRSVPANGTTSGLPRPASTMGSTSGSRLPMPKSKIAAPVGTTRRRAV